MLNQNRNIEPAGNQIDLDKPFPEVFNKVSDGHEMSSLINTPLRQFGVVEKASVDEIYENMVKRGIVKRES